MYSSGLSLYSRHSEYYIINNVIYFDLKAWLKQSPLPYRDHLVINNLVALPDDYSELINTVSLFTCPNSDRDDSRNPTMCLVCGEMLCSQSYCCQTELNKTLVQFTHTHRFLFKAKLYLNIDFISFKKGNVFPITRLQSRVDWFSFQSINLKNN